MARPKPDLPSAEALRALADKAGRLALRVTPGASADAIVLNQLKVQVRVRARAVDGAANAAVIQLIAPRWGLCRAR